MVVGAFPIAKLGTLLVRQISKPIANVVKERAKHNHFFRTYICMPPAQFYNWCEIKAKMWILDLGKPSVVPVLNEAMAIELGANLLGEGILFLIAASILYLEYARSARKEIAKEEAHKVEMDTLYYTIRELYFTTERQDAQIRELNREIVELGSRVVKKPGWIFPSKSDNSDCSEDQDLSKNPVFAIESNKFDDHSAHNHPVKKSGIVLQAVEDIQNNIIYKR